MIYMKVYVEFWFVVFLCSVAFLAGVGLGVVLAWALINMR